MLLLFLLRLAFLFDVDAVVDVCNTCVVLFFMLMLKSNRYVLIMIYPSHHMICANSEARCICRSSIDFGSSSDFQQP